MNINAERLVIVMPAYNEAATIVQVAKSWHEVLVRFGGPGSRLLVIDDGSKDETWQLLSGLQSELPGLTAMTQVNQGHGATLRQAYEWAVSQDADYVFQTDSDDQTDPADFAALWQQRSGQAALIGHRTHRQDGISRVFVAGVLKLVLWLCFGVWIPDANTPFRLIRRQSLAECLERIPPGSFLVNAQMAVILMRLKQPVRFVPITFQPRQGGQNSINLAKIFVIGLKAVQEFAKLRRNLA